MAAATFFAVAWQRPQLNRCFFGGQQQSAAAPRGDELSSAELNLAARKLGVELKENIIGPWYQMELYSKDRQIGKTSGWAQPWGLMHLETIEVRRFTGYWVQKPPSGVDVGGEEASQEKKKYSDVAKVARWFGLILSMSIACWNRERSPTFCNEAHLLAIKDEEKQHERLVRYYKSLGFKTLKEVDDLTFQDKVTWGGEGTLMNVFHDDFMTKWTPVVRELAGITTRSESGVLMPVEETVATPFRRDSESVPLRPPDEAL